MSIDCRVPAVSIFDSPQLRTIVADGDSPLDEVDRCSSSSLSSSSSSSIGKNSDLSGRSSDDEGFDEHETEVQSSFKGTFDSMEALEEVLPIRRGISKFYNGKSKSFTSLGEVSSSLLANDIAKPENAYTKKRKNLLAFNLIWEKSRNSTLRGNGGAISKKPLCTSRSTLALAVAMSSSESISDNSTDSTSSSGSRSPPCRPPLHPQTRAIKDSRVGFSSAGNLCPWRSLSVADLQECANSHNNVLLN